MKTGMSLEDMARELSRQKKSKRDFIAPAQKLSMRPTPDGVLLDGVNGGMPLRTVAHQQLSQVLGIPKPYYDRMLADAPDLLSQNVNNWLRRDAGNRMVRTLDNEVRAILSDGYRPLDNYDLAEAVLPQLTKLEARVESTQVTDNRFYLKAVTERVSAAVKVGDVVQAGVVVSNSEVGQGSMRVEALDFRLVCMNGMISGTAIRKAHLGKRLGDGNAVEDARELFTTETRAADDRAFFLKVRDTVRGMFDAAKFETRIDKYRAASERRITAAVPDVVELVAERLGLNEDESAGVLSHLISGGDLSQWGLANAVTRYAQDVDSYDRATDLETAGGRIIELPASEWRTLAVAA